MEKNICSKKGYCLRYVLLPFCLSVHIIFLQKCNCILANFFPQLFVNNKCVTRLESINLALILRQFAHFLRSSAFYCITGGYYSLYIIKS